MAITCPKCHSDNPDETGFCGKCGTKFPPQEDIAVTETIEAPQEELTRGTTLANRYEIIEELGKGGMGRVYRVEDTKLKQEVALKLIKPEIAKDKKTIERFRNELKLAREIAHRNVCRMYDLNEEKGIHYITMEYVRGEDLRGLIRRIGQLPIGKSISIANQVCEGLAEAHRLGVVHRDLKSNNIMIDKEGNVRIMDFGIARSLEAKGITGAGVMIGTPEYMSPEQVEGKEVDQRSDIYSLGVILYEMVTGRVPFEGDTPFIIGMKHKGEIPQDPKELNSQISDDFNRVILRCLEKEKERRFQSAGAVRSELENIEKGIPITERIIPERKPLTSREITVKFSLKKIGIPVLSFIAVIVIGIIICLFIPKRPSIPIQYDKPAIAVMYFENNTGDANLDHYRKAISDLLITDLSQSKHIQVVRGDKLYNILKQLNLVEARSYSSEDLNDVAAQGKASHILQGSYTKAGETFRINYMLHEANTEDLIGSERTEGQGEESIFTMVDKITKKVKANFKFSQQQIKEDIDRDIGTITTNSPEAFKFYTEARDDHSSGQYRKSIQGMEKAIAIDPEFAMAYRSLAISYNNLLLFNERTKYITKAMELSNRLSVRENYQIQGDFYSDSERTYGKAIEAFNNLLELYPEDYTASVNLGVLYSDINEYDKSIELLQIAVEHAEGRILAYTNLESYYRAKGRYEDARELLENYISNVSDHAAIHRDLSLLHIQQGNFDLAMDEIDKAFYLNPTNYLNLRRKGDIYLYQGDMIKAEEEYQKLLNLREPAASTFGFQRSCYLGLHRGQFKKVMDLSQQAIAFTRKFGQRLWEARQLLGLARTNYILGNFESALTECDAARKVAVEADDFSSQRRAHLVKGMVYLGIGDIDKAQEEADKLKTMIEKGIHKKAIRLFYFLQGKIEFEKKNYSEAIVNFNRAISLLFYGPLTKRADFIDSLALAYYESGDLDKALREYERITTLTTGRLGNGDIYTKSFYMLGKIYEQQGNTAFAIEYYEKFLDLWKDADPGIAEVDDARERLAGLKQ
jgi:tetratricopeptide (TPR) repeat protein/tRNA A-37 threonylcarbamoyl transferase component Bud32